VGERAGDCSHVVVEYVPVDIADAVASLLVARVKALASWPPQALACAAVFLSSAVGTPGVSSYRQPD
jgi:hypothetical protein